MFTLLFPYFMSTVLLEIFWKLTHGSILDALGIGFYSAYEYWMRVKCLGNWQRWKENIGREGTITAATDYIGVQFLAASTLSLNIVSFSFYQRISGREVEEESEKTRGGEIKARVSTTGLPAFKQYKTNGKKNHGREWRRGENRVEVFACRN